MADSGETARKPDVTRRKGTGADYVYPEPLTQDDLDAMDGTLRRPDSARWNLARLAASSNEDDVLARAGLDDWVIALEKEDRG